MADLLALVENKYDRFSSFPPATEGYTRLHLFRKEWGTCDICRNKGTLFEFFSNKKSLDHRAKNVSDRIIGLNWYHINRRSFHPVAFGVAKSGGANDDAEAEIARARIWMRRT